MQEPDKIHILRELRQEMLRIQGGRGAADGAVLKGLGAVEEAFPGGIFPTGAVHEFISYSSQEAGATNGFIAGILGQLAKAEGYCIWVSTRRSIFPPALKLFGIEPERILFIDPRSSREALWALEQALKCRSVPAVVAELPEISFTQSRRLQLAVESSRVTGFLHRCRPRSENTLACVSRWKIRPLPSVSELPGPGFPRWEIQLQRVRNGRPGSWVMEWTGSSFRHVVPSRILPQISKLKTG